MQESFFDIKYVNWYTVLISNFTLQNQFRVHGINLQQFYAIKCHHNHSDLSDIFLNMYNNY